jgi:hypothetical protein
MRVGLEAELSGLAGALDHPGNPTVVKAVVPHPLSEPEKTSGVGMTAVLKTLVTFNVSNGIYPYGALQQLDCR